MQRMHITLNIPVLRATDKPGIFTLTAPLRMLDYHEAAKGLGLNPEVSPSDARKLDSVLDHLQKLDIIDVLRDSLEVRNIEEKA